MNSTRKRLMRLPAAVALAATLSLGATLVRAQDAAKDTTPYTWTFKYAKGDVLRYRQQIDITSPDAQVALKSISKQEVKDVNPAGDATLENKTESSLATYNGTEIPDDPARHPTTTQVISKTGLLLKQAQDNGDPAGEKTNEIAAMLTQTPAPLQPVKIGDTWKTDIDNRAVQGKKVTVTSTLVGTEKVAGVDALKVHVTASIPPSADAKDADFVKVDGNYYVDPKAGRLLRAAYTIDNIDLPPPIGKSKINAKVDLIVPGVNDKEPAKTDAAQPKGQ